MGAGESVENFVVPHRINSNSIINSVHPITRTFSDSADYGAHCAFDIEGSIHWFHVFNFLIHMFYLLSDVLSEIPQNTNYNSNITQNECL